MMLEFIVSTDISHFWFGNLVEKLPVEVMIHDMISDDEGIIHYLIEVSLGNVSLPVLHEIIRDIDGIEIVNTGEIANNRVILTVCVDKCDICQTILSSGCFLKNAWTRGDRIIWKFLSPEKKNVKKIVERLESLNIRFELKKLGSYDEREILSSKQQRIVKIAYERGYFDSPKKTKIQDLADECGVSIATMHDLIRRATRNLIEHYYFYDD